MNKTVISIVDWLHEHGITHRTVRSGHSYRVEIDGASLTVERGSVEVYVNRTGQRGMTFHTTYPVSFVKRRHDHFMRGFTGKSEPFPRDL